MRTTSRATLLTVVLVLCSVAAASAANFCLGTVPPGNTSYILQGFALPAKGSCNTARGFSDVSGGTPFDSPVFGAVCASESGQIQMTLTDGITSFFIDLDRGTLAGTAFTCQGTSCSSQFNVAKTRCSSVKFQ